MAKRTKKQRRIRAVEDDDDRPRFNANKQNKTKKKKQTNFANDLTDTSRSATKRLRYDANKAQKGLGEKPGKKPPGKPGKGFGVKSGKRGGGKPGKGVGGKPGKGKPSKAFGKPQTAKNSGGRRKNK